MTNYNLPPGEELDRLVATIVCNKPEPTTVHGPHMDTKYSDASSIWHCTPDYYEGDVCKWEPVPFSTNITQAMLVLGRFDTWYMDRQDNGNYLVVIAQDGEGQVERSSLPHAICIAALKTRTRHPVHLVNVPEKPGRELDALVWLVLHGRPTGELMSCRYVDGDVQPHAGYPLGHISPPAYSTDIQRAFSVLDKLHNQGFGIINVSNGDGDSYDCNLISNNPWKNQVSAHAMGETWAHAICLAVVRALGTNIAEK